MDYLNLEKSLDNQIAEKLKRVGHNISVVLMV